MSYTFLLEQGEESSVESFSDIPVSVLLRLNLTAEKSCSKDSATESCQSSQSGMTCELSTENRGKEKLTLCAEGSRAKASVTRVEEKDCLIPRLAYGQSNEGLFARFDQESHLWKTLQVLLQGGLETFCQTWPQWGSMLAGECWALTKPELPKPESVSGWWPTPTASDAGNRRKNRYSQGGQSLSFVLGGAWNPTWAEWLMGWPIKWTEDAPLETDKFQQWLSLHGKP